MAAGDNDNDSLSYTLGDGTTVDSPAVLLQWCEANTQAASQLLVAGDFTQWFTKWGRDDLQQVAADAIARGRNDTEKISLFIGFSKVADYFKKSTERRFTFLLIGRTGVGKSSTINTLLGKEVAEVGDTVPVTTEVVAYDTEILGIPCRVVDTPGLSDGSHMDDDYITRMHKAVGEGGVDCVWFVTPLHETRVRDDEIGAINHITRAFGPDIWGRAVVVLSYADFFPVKEKFQQRMEGRPGPLRTRIAEAQGGDPAQPVGTKIADAIPFVAVTNEQDTTPDGAHWLGRLYVETLDRMSAAGFGPLFLALLDRTALAGRTTTAAADTDASAAPQIVIDRTLHVRVENVVSNRVYENTGYRPPQDAMEVAMSIGRAVAAGAKRVGQAISSGFSKLKDRFRK